MLSITDIEPIADGSMLYPCALDIAPEAVPGTYPLTPYYMVASTPHGYRLEVVAEDGEVLVAGAHESERAVHLDGGADASGDGCQIGAVRTRGLAWVLLLPAALAPWRRRGA